MEFETPTKVWQGCYVSEEMWSDETARAAFVEGVSRGLLRMIDERGGVRPVGDMRVRALSGRDELPFDMVGQMPDGCLMVIADWRIVEIEPEPVTPS